MRPCRRYQARNGGRVGWLVRLTTMRRADAISRRRCSFVLRRPWHTVARAKERDLLGWTTIGLVDTRNGSRPALMPDGWWVVGEASCQWAHPTPWVGHPPADRWAGARPALGNMMLDGPDHTHTALRRAKLACELPEDGGAWAWGRCGYSGAIKQRSCKCVDARHHGEGHWVTRIMPLQRHVRDGMMGHGLGLLRRLEAGRGRGCKHCAWAVGRARCLVSVSLHHFDDGFQTTITYPPVRPCLSVPSVADTVNGERPGCLFFASCTEWPHPGRLLTWAAITWCYQLIQRGLMRRRLAWQHRCSQLESATGSAAVAGATASVGVAQRVASM